MMPRAPEEVTVPWSRQTDTRLSGHKKNETHGRKKDFSIFREKRRRGHTEKEKKNEFKDKIETHGDENRGTRISQFNQQQLFRG